MAIAITHIPATVRSLLAAKDYRTLFSPVAFRDALFGVLWASIGPQVKTFNHDMVVALLEGRVKDGKVHDEVVGTPIYGTVLEVGAGSGMWVDVLSRYCKDQASNGQSNGGAADLDRTEGDEALRHRKQEGKKGSITKIYGVEPNPMSAEALRKRVAEQSLQDIYQVVPVGIESVQDASAWKEGRIEQESVDCIFGINCICSIPEPEKNIRLLYKLLKPGGHWYVLEHVKVSEGRLMLRLYQRVCNVFWTALMGSCEMCRETEKSLMAAGVWQQVDLAAPEGDSPYAVLPRLYGTLQK
ncbi:hypothetical protein BGZ73_001508 [Actinomortierella ambigua]|nr:hypothetical protein BGZ73_001508 [Actinomortierella ambigua]